MVIHKRLNQKLDIFYWQYCDRKYSMEKYVAWHWKDVTCKKCLKKRSKNGN